MSVPCIKQWLTQDFSVGRVSAGGNSNRPNTKADSCCEALRMGPMK